MTLLERSGGVFFSWVPKAPFDFLFMLKGAENNDERGNREDIRTEGKRLWLQEDRKRLERSFEHGEKHNHPPQELKRDMLPILRGKNIEQAQDQKEEVLLGGVQEEVHGLAPGMHGRR